MGSRRVALHWHSTHLRKHTNLLGKLFPDASGPPLTSVVCVLSCWILTNVWLRARICSVASIVLPSKPFAADYHLPGHLAFHHLYLRTRPNPPGEEPRVSQTHEQRRGGTTTRGDPQGEGAQTFSSSSRNNYDGPRPKRRAKLSSCDQGLKKKASAQAKRSIFLVLGISLSSGIISKFSLEGRFCRRCRKRPDELLANTRLKVLLVLRAYPPRRRPAFPPVDSKCLILQSQ